MLEKIGTIRNPLTIIAIFAGIAEISGTAVLPFISDGNQGTYVWFLMVFPVLLVVLFFFTLNFNHKVLYAPSDFKNEENFFKSLASVSHAERAEKLQEEVREIEYEASAEARQITESQSETKDASSLQKSLNIIRDRYIFAEELVIKKLSKELGQELIRGISFKTPDPPYIFDAIAVGAEKVTAIEVMYFRDERFIPTRFRDKFLRILQNAEQLPIPIRNSFSLIIAVAMDSLSTDHEQLTNRLYSLIGVTPFPVIVRIFRLGELEKELGPNGPPERTDS